MRTKEELKEAQSIAHSKWYAKNKAYKTKYRADKRDEINARELENRNSLYYVYSHINHNDDLYIGSGNKRRPYYLNRKGNWSKYFSKDTVKVAILKECETKGEARRIERNIIKAIGLDKLVNTNYVKDINILSK